MNKLLTGVLICSICILTSCNHTSSEPNIYSEKIKSYDTHDKVMVQQDNGTTLSIYKGVTNSFVKIVNEDTEYYLIKTPIDEYMIDNKEKQYVSMTKFKDYIQESEQNLDSFTIITYDLYKSIIDISNIDYTYILSNLVQKIRQTPDEKVIYDGDFYADYITELSKKSRFYKEFFEPKYKNRTTNLTFVYVDNGFTINNITDGTEYSFTFRDVDNSEQSVFELKGLTEKEFR